MRTGLIAEKLGMSRLLSEDGTHIPVTLLKVESCQVVDLKTEERDGYDALQLGAFTKSPKNISKSVNGHFSKAKVGSKRVLAEFRISKDAFLNIADELSVTHFQKGQFVDVTGVSKGKGFAGVMKRHNFSGLRASHGVSISHRSHGSTGQCQDPGKVFKGKKMAGHLGSEQVTKLNLLVVDVDETKGLIFVKGAVPGSKGSIIYIRDAVKKSLPESAPFPGALVNVTASKSPPKERKDSSDLDSSEEVK